MQEYALPRPPLRCTLRPADHSTISPSPTIPHETEFQNLFRKKPCEGAKTDSRANFNKETIAGARRRPKGVQYDGAQADSGRAQGMFGILRVLRLYSGILSSAQVKAAAAHVRRLKRNQRKRKLILSLGVFYRVSPLSLRKV